MKLKSREIIKLVQATLIATCLITISIITLLYLTNDYTSEIEALNKENALLVEQEVTYNISYSAEVEKEIKDRKNKKSYWYITFSTSERNGFTVRACNGYDFELSKVSAQISKEQKIGGGYLELNNITRISFEEYTKFKNR
jgi:hypothetical protein